MHQTRKTVIALAVASVFGSGMMADASAADSHSSGHTGGQTSKGGGRGPNYMGGDRGSGHSSQVHKGGGRHSDSGSGGSKSVEHKIFADSGHGGGRPATDDARHHDSETTRTH